VYGNTKEITMGTRKSGEQNVRNLTKNASGTYSISVPIELVRQLNWQVGQQVIVTKQGSKLVVQDWGVR
jgi:hypothetical protein